MKCEFLKGGFCEVATAIAGHDAETNESACTYCLALSDSKQINRTTVSLALLACVAAGDDEQRATVIAEQGDLLAGNKSGGDPKQFACDHRGEILRVVDCGYCGARQQKHPVYKCSLHGECALTVRVRSGKENRKVVICLSCDDITSE